METYQYVLLIIVLLIIVFKVRRYLSMRSLNNYSVNEVKRMIKENNEIVLLDVRTAKERKSGFIKPSIHIPLHEISTGSDQLKKYKSREIICYCQSGSRSLSAAIKLKKMGFNSANMKSGYSSW